ncbi:hypothetical protein NUW54_g11091 [Trametes sanguinea]|uniref:Uncharacterized protein n=1 Tax=Trametes sanguinea TaxID=158606 RepID=A0ACC1NKC4_9APHY|nr:hypothetical protein NUW54_g11091 [Trametes sanguinea]
MSKRQLSPAPLPPSKRIHANQPVAVQYGPSVDAMLSDEIALFIFSYLSPSDLCAVQCTNRNWARLALDNQLWKSLYISEYGRTRLRGARGFIGRGDGREIKPLPGRAKAEGMRDWKWMFRISSNWRTGRCSLEHYQLGIPPRLFIRAQTLHQTHLLLAGNITIMASSVPSPTPSVLLASPAMGSTQSLALPPIQAWLRMSPRSHWTNRRPHLDIMGGSFASCLRENTVSSTSTTTPLIPLRECIHISHLAEVHAPHRLSRPAYHHPLLVTLLPTHGPVLRSQPRALGLRPILALSSPAVSQPSHCVYLSTRPLYTPSHTKRPATAPQPAHGTHQRCRATLGLGTRRSSLLCFGAVVLLQIILRYIAFD